MWGIKYREILILSNIIIMKKKKVSISTFHIVWYNNIFYILNEYYAYIFIYIYYRKS